MSNSELLASFAWTATHETAEYKHYPPYVNLSGNRLAVRANEQDVNGYPEPGAYAAIDLPPEEVERLASELARTQLDELRAALEACREKFVMSATRMSTEAMRTIAMTDTDTPERELIERLRSPRHSGSGIEDTLLEAADTTPA